MVSHVSCGSLLVKTLSMPVLHYVTLRRLQRWRWRTEQLNSLLVKSACNWLNMGILNIFLREIQNDTNTTKLSLFFAIQVTHPNSHFCRLSEQEQREIKCLDQGPNAPQRIELMTLRWWAERSLITKPSAFAACSTSSPLSCSLDLCWSRDSANQPQ